MKFFVYSNWIKISCWTFTNQFSHALHSYLKVNNYLRVESSTPCIGEGHLLRWFTSEMTLRRVCQNVVMSWWRMTGSGLRDEGWLTSWEAQWLVACSICDMSWLWSVTLNSRAESWSLREEKYVAMFMGCLVGLSIQWPLEWEALFPFV